MAGQETPKEIVERAEKAITDLVNLWIELKATKKERELLQQARESVTRIESEIENMSPDDDRQLPYDELRKYDEIMDKIAKESGEFLCVFFGISSLALLNSALRKVSSDNEPETVWHVWTESIGQAREAVEEAIDEICQFANDVKG